MSRVIDERTVEMRFDNSKFESNARETIGTLKELDNTLQVDSFRHSFDGMDRALGNVDLSSLADGLAAINERFSTLGVVGMTVVSNLTNRMVDSVASAFHKVGGIIDASMNQIKTGGLNRAMNIEKAKFQLQGLGIAYEDVAKQIDYAVSGTAYSLDAAAQAAAQLSSANIDYRTKLFLHKGDNEPIDAMAISLRAVSGVAAQTQSDFSMVARYFQDVANAGKLTGGVLTYMTQVLNLPVAQNLAEGLNAIVDGSFEASDAVKKNAKEITKGAQISAEEIKDLASKGLIEYDTFAQIMFNKYADHAVDANKTLTGVWANLKSALSRVGEPFASALIKNEGPLVQVLEALRKKVNEFKTALAGSSSAPSSFVKDYIQFVEVLKDLALNVIDKLNFDGIQDFATGLENILFSILLVLRPIRQAFTDIFPPKLNTDIKSLGERFKDFTERLIISEETSEKIRAAFTRIFAAIKVIAGSIGDVFAALSNSIGGFEGVKNIILSIADSFKQWVSSIVHSAEASSLFSGIMSALVKSVDIALRIISLLFNLIGSGTTAILPFLDSVKSGISELLINFGSGIDKSFTKIKEAIFKIIPSTEEFKERFSSISDVFKPIIDGISYALSVVWQGLTKIDFSKVFQTGSLAAFIVLFRQLFLKWDGFVSSWKRMDLAVNWIENLKKAFEGLGGLTGILDGVRLSLVNWVKELKSETLMKQAAAVAILAGALLVLSSIDSESLARGLVAVSILFAEIAAAFTYLDKSSSSLLKAPKTLEEGLKNLMGVGTGTTAIYTKLSQLSLALIAISASVLILATAVKKLSTIPTGDLVASVIAVGALMVALMKVTEHLDNRKFVEGAGGMILLSVAIGILASAVKSLSALPIDQLFFGLLGIGALLTAMVLVTERLDGKAFMSGASGLILTAVAIRLLVKAVDAFGQMNPDALLQGVFAVAALLVELGTFAKLVNGADLIAGSIGLLVAAAAMNVLALAIRQLGNMTVGELAKGLISMGLALAELAVGLTFMMAALPGAIALGVASVGLIALATAFKIMASLNWADTIQVLLTLGGVLVELAIGLTAMMFAIPGAIALTIAAAGIFVLSAALAMLSSVDPWGMLYALGGLAGALLILGVAATAMTPLLPALFGLGAALALIGVATLALGVGISSLAAGLTALVAMVTASGASIVAALSFIVEAIVTVIVEVFRVAGEAILNGLVFLAENAQTIAASLVTILSNILVAIIEIGGMLIVKLIEGITQYLPMIVQAAIDLAITFIESLATGIENNTDRFLQACGHLLEAFIGAIIKSGQSIYEEGWHLIEKFGGGLSEKITDIVEIGKDVVSGFVQGITETIGTVIETAKNLGKGVIDAVRGALDSHSPSQEMVSVGEDTDEGFIIGLLNKSGDLNLTAEGIGDSVISIFRDKMAEINAMCDEMNAKANYAQNLAGSIDSRNANQGEHFYSEHMGPSGGEMANQSDHFIDAMDLKSNSEAYNKYMRSIGRDTRDTSKTIKDSSDESANAVEEASKRISEATKGGAGSAKSAADTIKGSFADMQKTLKGKIEGSISIFDKWKTNTESISKTDLLSNMKSQLDGVASWSAKVAQLADKGITQKLYQKLAEMGPQGEKYVDAFLSMTAEEMAQANDMFTASLAMPDAATNQIYSDADKIGSMIGYSLVNSLAMQVPQVGEQSATLAKDGIIGQLCEQLEIDPNAIGDAPAEKMVMLGYAVSKGLEEGIITSEDLPKDGVETVGNEANEEAENQFSSEKWAQYGAWICEGISSGIDSNSSIVKTAIEQLASKLSNTFHDSEMDYGSPSRTMMTFGKWTDEGLAIGIRQNASMVTNAADDLGSDTLDSFNSIINHVRSSMGDNADLALRPVLDLSDIRSKASMIGGIINGHSVNVGMEDGLKNGSANQNGGVTFVQNNYSPKALSRIDIYRQTRNQLSGARGAMV